MNGDIAVQGETNIFLYDAPEFTIDDQFEVGAAVGYRGDNGFSAKLFARNLTDEENLKGAIDFNNLTGFVNEPRIFGVELAKSF